MPEHIVKATPPLDGLNAGAPSDNLTGSMGHPTSQNIVVASPNMLKSLSTDSFTDDQPRNKTDVKSGQGPI